MARANVNELIIENARIMSEISEEKRQSTTEQVTVTFAL